jgi:hypothetical protein
MTQCGVKLTIDAALEGLAANLAGQLPDTGFLI